MGHARRRHWQWRDGGHNDEQRRRRLGQREEVLREGRHEGPVQGQERRREPRSSDEEDVVRRLRRRRHGGRPLQGHVGPALNILIKLMSMVSLTIAPLLKTYDKHWEFYYW